MGFLTHKRAPEKRTYNIEDSPCKTYGMLNAILDINNFPAMNLSPIYAATSIISNSVALLPITAITEEKNKKLVLDESFIYHLFDDTLMSKFTTIKTMMMDLLLWGNAYAYIDRSGGKISLRYLNRSEVSVNYDPITEKLSYSLAKFVVNRNVTRNDIIHLTINAADGVNGRGILHFAEKSISLSKNTEKAANEYFSSGCRIHGVLSTDAPSLTPQAREDIRKGWIQSQTTGTAILEAGMKYSSTTDDPAKAQMIETRLFNLQEICRFFNISPIMLGDLSHTQYGSIEQAQIEFVQHCLMPYIEMIENELNRKLMPVDSNIYINLDTNVLLKSDKQSEANYITTLVSNGILTPNEGRSILGYNAIEGGDVIMVNYTNIEDNVIAEQEQ